MHDPSTVAFDINTPWGRPLVSIWHCDPESDGGDDSCGWSYVRLSKEDLAWAKKQADFEWRTWLSPEFGAINLEKAGDLEVLAALWGLARHRATGRHAYRPLSPWDVSQAMSLACNPHDNLLGMVRDARTSPEEFERLLVCVLKCYRTAARPWWRHPKWHVHHWQIQVHGLGALRRWALSRCSGCGAGFAYGESPCSVGWSREKDPWYRGESGVYHLGCLPAPDPRDGVPTIDLSAV